MFIQDLGLYVISVLQKMPRILLNVNNITINVFEPKRKSK